MKPTLIRDVPIGILVMLSSFFILYGAWFLTGFIPIFNFLLIVISVVFFRFIFLIGFYIARGMDLYVK